MKTRIIFFILTVLPFYLSAQYYVQGEDPGKIHWKQINTENFQVIFPDEFELKARSVASILEKVYLYAGQTLHHKPRKISVILHTKTLIANGFVAWTPARMELFTTPDQSIYAQEWLEQLAIHEFRHVVQIDKIESELPGIFKGLLGEQAAALVIGAYLPFWFLEGDAVATETALSHSGRGRVPSFTQELKAIALEKGFYSYDKSYFGSYKNYIPDYYQFGYQMVAGIRSGYGSDTWTKVLNNVAKKPLSLNAFSQGLKNATGKNHIQLYKELFSNLKNSWLDEDNKLQKSEFKTIENTQKGYNSYRYPYQVSDSSYFAVKYSLDDLTKFVIINSKGTERTIFTPGTIANESVTFGNGKVYWIEVSPDIRWAHRELSELRILDLASTSTINKRFHHKIFAPSLSHDGKYLAAVKLDSLNNSSILLLSPLTGELIKESVLQSSSFVLSPTWSADDTELYTVVLGTKGKTIAKINPFNGRVSELFPYEYSEFQHPFQKNNYLYYTNSLNGVDNIYAYDLTKNVNYRITSSRFGANDAYVTKDDSSLIYSNYTSDGYKTAKIRLNRALFIPVKNLEPYNFKLADQLSSFEKGIPELNNQDTSKLITQTYSKLGHLFNFHSWAPFQIDNDKQEIRPGFSLLSQNKLSTAVTQLGYDYSTSNKTGKWIGKFNYTGLFPVISLDIDYGPVKSQYYQVTRYTNNIGQVVKIDTQKVNYIYKELNFNGLISLPLNLSHGKIFRLIQPEFKIGVTNVIQAANTPSNLFRGSIIPFSYRLYANNYLRMSVRDIQPAWGQIVDLTFRNTPFGNRNYGTIWSSEGTIFMPGFFKHHGFRFYGGIQKKKMVDGMFSDIISYPRGCSNILNNQLAIIKLDYVFPFWYPDLNIGSLSYFKRFSMRIFYDYASAVVPGHGSISDYRYDFGSTGAEVIGDCNILRLMVPAQIGIRTSYLTNQKSVNFEFIFSFNIKAL